MGLFDKVAKSTSIGSLFGRHKVKQEDLNLYISADPGYFYELYDSEMKVVAHALFKTKTKPGTMTRGPRIPMNCLFETHWLLRDGQRVGFVFVSQFQVENHGGYLLTYQSQGAGKATTSELLAKTDDMVVYHYPNRGTLVLSPLVSPAIASVLDEQ